MTDLYSIFLIVHIVSLVLLAGVTFAALAAPQPERRKFSLMWSGILGVVVFVTGFGLLGIRQMPFQGWVTIKLVCWLALAMMVPMVFRQPEKSTTWSGVTIGAILVAVTMVVWMPF
jgi:uncharacterized membrane protein SirB2